MRRSESGAKASERNGSSGGAAFEDLHFAVEEIVAEGDKVVTRWTLTGRQVGEFLGIPATGRGPSAPRGMSLDTVRDGGADRRRPTPGTNWACVASWAPSARAEHPIPNVRGQRSDRRVEFQRHVEHR